MFTDEGGRAIAHCELLPLCAGRGCTLVWLVAIYCCLLCEWFTCVLLCLLLLGSVRLEGWATGRTKSITSAAEEGSLVRERLEGALDELASRRGQRQGEEQAAP